MRNNKNKTDQLFQIDDEQIKIERHKARDLRKTQWWKRSLSKGLCYYCKETFSPNELTMDHIVPVAKGGKSTKNNLVTACKECNNKKKQFLVMEWKGL